MERNDPHDQVQDVTGQANQCKLIRADKPAGFIERLLMGWQNNREKAMMARCREAEAMAEEWERKAKATKEEAEEWERKAKAMKEEAEEWQKKQRKTESELQGLREDVSRAMERISHAMDAATTSLTADISKLYHDLNSMNLRNSEFCSQALNSIAAIARTLDIPSSDS